MAGRAALVALPLPKPLPNSCGARPRIALDEGACGTDWCELARASTVDESSSCSLEAPEGGWPDTDDGFEQQGGAAGMPEGGWPDTDDEFGCGGCALRRMAAARRGGAAPLRRAADSAGPSAAGPGPGVGAGAAACVQGGALGTASYVQGGARGHHADVGGDGAVTTLMIRNIPSRLSQQDVVSLLDSSGYAGKYDFLHVPCDFDTRLNKGHAFVNFDEPGIATALAAAWHGQHIFDSEAGQHPLNVAPSLVQGLEANMKKWGWSRYRRVRTSGFRPFIRGTDATEQ